MRRETRASTRENSSLARFLVLPQREEDSRNAMKENIRRLYRGDKSFGKLNICTSRQRVIGTLTSERLLERYLSLN